MKRPFITLCALLAAFASDAQSLQLSLEQCRDMALAHNEKLAQADNAVEQAKLDRKIASAAALPKLDGSAMGLYGLPDMDMMGMELQMRGTYLAGVNLTQPIYTGGKITAGKRLASIGEDAASEQRRMTRADVIVEADRAYWTYVAVCRKVKMMESYMAQMDTLLHQSKAAVEAGMATDGDQLRIEAKRSEIDYQLQKTKNGAELCRLALCNVIGADWDEQPIVESEGLDSAQEDLPPLATQPSPGLRPELSLLNHQIAADKEQIRLTRADMLPTVALSAGYAYYGNLKLKGYADDGTGAMQPYKQEFSDGTGMLMLSVQIPIFHWGETSKKVRKARLALRNSELEKQRTSSLLTLEAEQAARNLNDSRNLIAAAKTSLRHATENLRVTQNRYTSSMSPLTDLLDAQSQWQQAESNLTEALTQMKIYETEYLRATGQL